MGTDRIRLFDKPLGDSILAMDQHGLIQFLEQNLDKLSHRTWHFNPVDFELKQNGGSITDVVQRLLDEDYTLPQLKSSMVQDFAFGEEEILIDYWGCYAALFVDHPEGSISSLDYLPDEEEETFVLLRAEHVARMTASLRAHIDDLSVMDAKQIEKVEEWQALCSTNPNYLVAYQFDF
jgi:hypothetical protein